MQVERLGFLIRNFRKRSADLTRKVQVSVIVGYTAAYALYVHENREIWPPGMRLAGQPRPRNRGLFWDPQGQAKPAFLIDPAREKRHEIGRIIVEVTKNTGSISSGMFMAGLYLQRLSQEQVPVDTGVLKASAFTRFD